MRDARNLAFICFVLFAPHRAVAQGTAWIATWAASPQPVDGDPDEPLLKIEDQTVRERVRVSIGGSQIRVRLSNECGATPLLIGSVTVARPTDPASIRPGSVRLVTFGGRNSITIAPGAPVVSDPVEFSVLSGAEVSVSLYFPKRVANPTLHVLALKRAVVSQRGDHTSAEKVGVAAESGSSISVTAVLVPAPPFQRLLVAFGDSVTDGDGSTMEEDHNWPSDLNRRLAKTPEGSKMAVVNAGIGGNRLLSDGSGISAGFGVSGLARFDRDALALPGVTHIGLLEGLNDIGFPGAKLGRQYLADPADTRTARELIDAYLQLISRGHAHGVKLMGATISPFEGADFPGYYSEAKESSRQAVNKWIRTSGAFDGVIDFDAVLRDPSQPTRLLPMFASKDHLHPNDDGYRAMADAIDLALFK
jgi:lysophospholipase L1-like esterase